MGLEYTKGKGIIEILPDNGPFRNYVSKVSSVVGLGMVACGMIFYRQFTKDHGSIPVMCMMGLGVPLLAYYGTTKVVQALRNFKTGVKINLQSKKISQFGENSKEYTWEKILPYVWEGEQTDLPILLVHYNGPVGEDTIEDTLPVHFLENVDQVKEDLEKILTLEKYR